MNRKKTLAFGLAFLFLIAPGNGAADDSAKSAGEMGSSPGSIEFVGRNLIANAEGVFHRWRIVEKTLDLSAPASSSVVVEIDLSSIDTQNKSRDEHLRTADFFDVDQYPKARVRGYGLALLEHSQSEAQNRRPRYSVSFEIDLHGVQKTIQGEVELVQSTPPVVEGDLEINRVDFGIGEPASRWNPMAIKEIIPVHFRVEL